jgi:transcriptional regulator with XRE-family HTH domain
MEKDKLEVLRVLQCQRLADLAKSKHISYSQIATATGYDRSNVIRVLRGQYSPTLDVLNNIANAIGYNLDFVNNDLINSKVERINPKFLICPDAENKELYILHRMYPACLIWIKQETPVRFIVLDMYDELENEADILQLPFVQEAKDFYFKMVENSMDKN